MLTQTVSDAEFVGLLNNLNEGAINATATLLNLFDNGVKIYGGVANRVQAIKQISRELAKPEPEIVQVEDPSKKSLLKKIFEDKNNLVVIGAISVLALAVIFSKGK